LNAPAPGSNFACIELRRLQQEFADAVSEHHRIQSAQVAAVMNGEVCPFEKELAEALTRKENAKYAIIAHQEKHGC
jgi:hypothetical protein